jgi:hypothetical protein
MRTTITALFLFLLGCCQAQNEPKPFHNLIDVRPEQEWCVKSLVNRLKIDTKGLHINKIVFRPDSFSQIIKEDGVYEVLSKRGGSNVTVYDSLNNGTLKKLAVIPFSFVPIPPPICRVAGKTGEFSMTKEEIKKLESIGAPEEWNALDFEYDVASFEMFTCIGGTWVHEESESRSFTPEMKADFTKLNKGDKIYITNVKCKAPNKVEIVGVTITVED